MVRTKDADGIKSNLIISEVQKRPCLFDMNHPHYGDRAEKAKSWEEVCENVVPGWTMLGLEHKFSAGKEVQKRWRSIRDSFTKAYRQGKCLLPEECTPGSRRFHYHRQMSFLLRALKNKKPRLSREFEVLSEISSSPHHNSEDLSPKLIFDKIEKPIIVQPKIEITEKTRPKRDKQTTEAPTKIIEQVIRTTVPNPFTKKPEQVIEKPEEIKERPESLEKTVQTNIIEVPVEKLNSAAEIKIGASPIAPDDYFEDDKLFMNSLLPSFKKMNDDTRLLCRIEILKIIRFALQGRKNFENVQENENHNRFNYNGYFRREGGTNELANINRHESTLSMTTRSADGSRPIRRKRSESPYTPYNTPPIKKRGPGRPRKIRPPPSDSDEERPRRRQNMKPLPTFEPRMSEYDEELNRATSVAQLNTPSFMKMYNLERSKNAPNVPGTQHMEVSVKSEPMDSHNELT